VGNESILARIVRQCRERGVEPIVVTHKLEIAQATDAVCHIPTRNGLTVETFLSSPWGERTIVLLGDVVYSKTVMNRIFNCRENIRVFGNEYEIYAISFMDKVSAYVRIAIANAGVHASRGGPGTLRKFYQAYCGIDLDSDGMEGIVLDRVCYIQDYTMDVDTPRDYKNLLNKVVKGGLLDDCSD